jgi:hypothetical protein
MLSLNSLKVQIKNSYFLKYFLLLVAMVVLLSGCGYMADPTAPEMFSPRSLEGLTAEFDGNNLLISWNQPELNRMNNDFKSAELSGPFVYEIYVAPIHDFEEIIRNKLKFSDFTLIASVAADKITKLNSVDNAAPVNKVGYLISNPLKGRRIAYVITTRAVDNQAVGATDTYLSVYINDYEITGQPKQIDVKLGLLSEIYKNPTNFAS